MRFWPIQEVHSFNLLFSVQFVLLLVCFGGTGAKSQDSELLFSQNPKVGEKDVQLTHSCIHDEILHQRRRPGRKEYSVTPQIYYQSSLSRSRRSGGRALLEVSSAPLLQKDAKQPIRILLNYDAVGHSLDRDCQNVGELVKVNVFLLDNSSNYEFRVLHSFGVN